MNPAPLLRLPPEILDGILALIDNHEDILSFALANKECSQFAIPRHTQYRILRIRHPYPQLWAHLAQRADLASFITHVHITDRNTRILAERKPSTLVSQTVTQSEPDETTRILNMCRAISNMKSLRSFIWEFRMKLPYLPTLLPEHEDAILRALRKSRTLEYLALIGPFGTRAPSYNHDPESKHYPLWRFGNIRFLNLLGDTWVRPAVTYHVLRLLANLAHLEHLQIPLEFSHLHRLTFPDLKTLRLQLLTGASASLDLTRSQFIERHTTLEHLCWFPLALPLLTPEALPDLKRLSTTRHVVECLASVAPPPPTPSSMTFAVFQNLPPITEDPRETNTVIPTPSGSIKRPIECLDVRSLDARSLLDFHQYFLDSTKLRKLKLHTFYDVSDVCQVGDTFPEITWLWLPNAHLPSASAHPKAVELEDLYTIVSHFPRLEVLRGQAIWSAVGNNLDQMHHAIFQLAMRLPNLKQIDHSAYDDNKQAYKRIAIERVVMVEDGKEVEHLNYRVVKPKPRDTWDIFEGSFE
ncbi:hypothetical protein NP233_g6299 [Leucocoprinus birnbaumii]|uniref:F-box domain-containing protein n=1 Tax=Leucocoprinus birnbaumii TaxID=56174 RepID=A0AAD5VU25_9AGAR|nr:hypothetical protein NP233_g6299 [Leucocoprinus birnbaumii]